MAARWAWCAADRMKLRSRSPSPLFRRFGAMAAPKLRLLLHYVPCAVLMALDPYPQCRHIGL